VERWRSIFPFQLVNDVNWQKSTFFLSVHTGMQVSKTDNREFDMFKRLITLFLITSLSGCGYNSLQSADENIKAAWAEVLNQYQRRADLVPNLVNVVKGYAAHEKDVLTEVTEARARVGAIQATPELINDEEAFKQFIAAQGQMTSAISRLLVVAENYPQLKADGLFRDLQAQLEGTENRITVARNRYIAAVREYNLVVRSFPSNLTAMLFGYKIKPSFTVENEKAISEPPKVDFSAPAPVSAVPAPAPAPAPTQALPLAPGLAPALAPGQ
jgi:LemA protein